MLTDERRSSCFFLFFLQNSHHAIRFWKVYTKPLRALNNQDIFGRTFGFLIL